jgi:hypothetical protein
LNFHESTSEIRPGGSESFQTIRYEIVAWWLVMESFGISWFKVSKCLKSGYHEVMKSEVNPSRWLPRGHVAEIWKFWEIELQRNLCGVR